MIDSSSPQPAARAAWSLGPWTSDGLLRALGLNSAALLIMLIAWYMAAGETRIGDQVVWLNVALGGLGLSALANATLLLRGRRAIGFGLAALGAVGPLTSETAKGVQPLSQRVVAAPGMTRFHRPDCPFTIGRGRLDDRRALERRGLTPCEVCEP